MLQKQIPYAKYDLIHSVAKFFELMHTIFMSAHVSPKTGFARFLCHRMLQPH